MKKSPWKRELVSVGGRDLSLNDIENEIFRDTDLFEGEVDVKFMDYDWSLNESKLR